ncbi:MAG: hypothetical protein ACI8RZ_004223 [Myxococcota bacterium]|jgi:hypothetical protein
MRALPEVSEAAKRALNEKSAAPSNEKHEQPEAAQIG